MIQSETGIKRNVRFEYPARFEAGPPSPGVLLEMGVRGGPQPRTTMRLRSLAAEHAMAGGAEEGEFDELAIVEVEVLASERTLVEKLALLHGLAAGVQEEGGQDRLERSGRHYYDVHRLLGHQATLDACAQAGCVAGLAEDIDIQSRRYGWSSSPRPALGYAQSPAFDPSHPSHEAAEAGYRRAAALVFGAVPTFEECVARVHANAAIL